MLIKQSSVLKILTPRGTRLLPTEISHSRSMSSSPIHEAECGRVGPLEWLKERSFGDVGRCSRWFVAVMPSSEEESQWLVGSGGGLVPSGGGTVSGVAGERAANVRGGLYTEEMTTQPANSSTAGVNTASADSAEHDLIDSTADATLLAQFHEDAIKQVRSPGSFSHIV